MNRIYKVIYSKARQCYIVVSELAKSNHKSSQQGADRTNTPALARIIAVALAAAARRLRDPLARAQRRVQPADSVHGHHRFVSGCAR